MPRKSPRPTARPPRRSPSSPTRGVPRTARAPTWGVPAALYTRTDEVRRTAARFVTAVRKGRAITDAFGDELVPVDAKHPGLLVLDRAWSLIPTAAPQFHLDLPWRRLCDTCLAHDDDETLARARREALAAPWSFIGLVGGHRYPAVFTAAAQLEVLEAAVVHWPQLAAAGARYTTGSNVGKPLTEMNTLVTFCLARQGAPRDDLHDLTPVRLEKHVSSLAGLRVRAQLARGDVTRALAELKGHQDIALCSLAEHFLRHGLDDEVCAAVTRISKGKDPHGIVARWLARRGDPHRLVG